MVTPIPFGSPLAESSFDVLARWSLVALVPPQSIWLVLGAVWPACASCHRGKYHRPPSPCSITITQAWGISGRLILSILGRSCPFLGHFCSLPHFSPPVWAIASALNHRRPGFWRVNSFCGFAFRRWILRCHNCLAGTSTKWPKHGPDWRKTGSERAVNGTTNGSNSDPVYPMSLSPHVPDVAGITPGAVPEQPSTRFCSFLVRLGPLAV